MVVARWWQQWITKELVYHCGWSGFLRNTDARDDHAIRRVGHVLTNNISKIGLTAFNTFETSDDIKGNHLETTC
ncbi:hypothetical protein TNCV_3391821 [Trichonephila clavipes]|nr:hypothetical protein TNCV_3391821 [Trichonephila clavipes]